jgi:hypothetical protein
MPARKTAYVPAMSDASVKAKTGKDWNGWFAALDKAGAAKLDHKSIAALIAEKYGIPGWWCQKYERARGLRARHQTTDGFTVSASKTIGVSLPKLYAATANAAQRKKWFPQGAFEPSSQTKDKYLNGSWNGSARLNIGFYAKGGNKSQIALQVSKLSKEADVELERQAWKAALSRLQTMLAS